MLTDAAIQRALRAGKDTRLSDGRGKSSGRLVMVIRSKRGEWYAQQWLNGKKRMRKLGSYPALSLAMARERFFTDFAETIATKSDIRVTVDARPSTLQELFEGYLDYLLKAGKARAHRDTKYALDRALKHLNPNALAGHAGLSKDDRDRLQCHAQSDVSSRHYDRYEYLKEKRQAMDKWSDWFRAEIEKAS